MALSCILKNFGTSFATRERGRELRESLYERADGGLVVLDFSGVTNVSYSFADELVGKLRADGIDVELVSMSGPVERSVRRAVERRAGASVGC
jgi:anti-anti-sigma regulatory factor